MQVKTRRWLVSGLGLTFTVALVGVSAALAGAASEATAFWGWLAAAVAAALVVGGGTLKMTFASFANREYWFEQIIDAMHQPISVTDLDMNWTFINRPVEQMLGVKRADKMGQQCSNWGAPICNTKDCGVACLRTGKLQTVFEQAGGRYTVDTSYLLDLKGNKVGHIEVVSDITAQGRLKKLVGQVQEEMVALINNTREIAAASQTVSQGATEQAAALEELTSAMSEIGGQTNANAERAAQANRLAASAKESSEQGNRQMGLMVGAMNGISESSQNIAKIIKVIDDIAFQTNLLALNAAVEAARAGKYGKGFAVVAEEVRNLAGRSAKAARETSELIEGAVREVESGVAIVDQTATALGAISDSVSKVATLTKEISDATGEQAEGIAQVNSGLEQVGLVTEQNTANAEETAASSQEMSRLAQELNHLVSSMALENAGAAGEKQAAPAQNLPRAKAAKQLPPAS